VVALHINMLIDDLLTSATLKVARSIGGESPGREVGFRRVVGVPTDVGVRRQDATDHVVDAPLGDSSVEDGDGEVGTLQVKYG